MLGQVHVLSAQSPANLDDRQDRRAHHNALERRRRDSIKDSFGMLRDCVPVLLGEKVGSRCHSTTWLTRGRRPGP